MIVKATSQDRSTIDKDAHFAEEQEDTYFPKQYGFPAANYIIMSTTPCTVYIVLRCRVPTYSLYLREDLSSFHEAADTEIIGVYRRSRDAAARAREEWLECGGDEVDDDHSDDDSDGGGDWFDRTNDMPDQGAYGYRVWMESLDIE